MKQEFITSRGKAILENNSLFLKNYKIDFRQTIAGQIWFPLVLIAAGVLKFIRPTSPVDYYIGTFWILFFLIFQSGKFYNVVVRKSFSSRIPLNRIVSFKIEADEFELETEVILQLKNGRYRSIAFRTMEKQYEDFIEALSAFVAYPHMA